MYFYRGRYYSPTLQRFLSEDPAGIAGGINLYAYAANNPIQFIDPFAFDKKDPMSSQQPQQPEPQQQKQTFKQCFDNMVNQTSLQTTFHAGNGFLANTFLSNSVGEVVNTGYNFLHGNLWGSVKSAWSAAGDQVIEEAAKYVPNPVSVTPIASVESTATLTVNGVTVAEASASTTFMDVAPMAPIGTIAENAADFLNYFNVPKMVYDTTSAVGSAMVCAAQ